MRRRRVPLVVLGLSAALGACGVAAVAETPQTALATVAQNTAQLKSVKYDFTGSIALKLPAAMQSQSLGLAGGTLAINFTGTGEAVFPGRSHITVAIRMGSISATTETVVIGSTVYVKNPMTGRWTKAVAASAGATSLTQADPLSYAQLLDAAQSITDLGDTTLAGVAVHHYRVLLDKAKLIERAQSLPAYNNPQAQQLFRQIIDHGSLTLEVWFGKDDHLARRISTDASLTLDAAQLGAALGGGAVPAGSVAQMTEQSVINYHDFNAPVTVNAPSLG